uniref:Uncharacterized protein n=1 Tax=Mycena chlorophos TaxID=658473 RepID=A0ABQ0LEL1_MYCCL|nr:predicted protein [Mycena chlorophos]
MMPDADTPSTSGKPLKTRPTGKLRAISSQGKPTLPLGRKDKGKNQPGSARDAVFGANERSGIDLRDEKKPKPTPPPATFLRPAGVDAPPPAPVPVSTPSEADSSSAKSKKQKTKTKTKRPREEDADDGDADVEEAQKEEEKDQGERGDGWGRGWLTMRGAAAWALRVGSSSLDPSLLPFPCRNKTKSCNSK